MSTYQVKLYERQFLHTTVKPILILLCNESHEIFNWCRTPYLFKTQATQQKTDRISYSNVCLLQIQLYNFPRQHCVNPHLAKYIPRILKQIVQGADF